MANEDLNNKYPWIRYWSDNSVVDWMSKCSRQLLQNMDAVKSYAIYEMYRQIMLNYDIKTVLDLGCGSGHTLKILKSLKPNAKCFGGDLSWELLNKSRELSSDGYFVQCDALNLGFKDGAFDLAVSEDLQCIVSDNRTLLQELCRVSNHFLCLSLRLRGRGKTIYDINDSYQLVEPYNVKVPYVALNFREFTDIIAEVRPNATFAFCKGYRIGVSKTIHIKNFTDYVVVGIIAIDMTGECQAIPGATRSFRDQCRILYEEWEKDHLW